MILMMLDIYENDRYSRGKRGFNDRFWTIIVYLIGSTLNLMEDHKQCQKSPACREAGKTASPLASFAPLKLCESDAYGDQKETEAKMSKKSKAGLRNINSCFSGSLFF